MTSKNSQESNKPGGSQSEWTGKLAKAAPAIAGIFSTVLLALAGVWGYHMYQESQEKKAQEELYVFEFKIETIEQEIYNAKLEGQRAKESQPLPVIEKTPAAFERNFAEFIKQYEAKIFDYKSLRAAAVSAILLADKYSQYGMNDKAKKLLAKLESSIPNNVLKALVNLQRISLTEKTMVCEQISSQVESILKDQDLKFLWPEAYLRKAACAISNNDFEKASDAINKLNTDFSDSVAARKIHVLQRLKAIKTREGV